MNKLIKNGKVAVLYSPGFGAGWFTWNPTMPELIFEPNEDYKGYNWGLKKELRTNPDGMPYYEILQMFKL